MLLPMIIFSHDLSTKIEDAQRETRVLLWRIEHAVNFQASVISPNSEDFLDDQGLLNFDYINRDLSLCHSLAIWKG